jgi:hypothetical protein
MAHPSARVPLASNDDAGLALGPAAFVAFTSQIHLVRLHHRRRPGIAVARTPERRALRPLGHGVTEPLVQIPARLIAQAQPATEFDRRDRLFGAGHQVHGAEPGGQGQLGVCHDGARGDRPASARRGMLTFPWSAGSRHGGRRRNSSGWRSAGRAFLPAGVPPPTSPGTDLPSHRAAQTRRPSAPS